MKSLSDVNKTRAEYHKNPNKDTVHRSSLIAPRIGNAITNICFLNHFLIKRKYEEVTLKITALDASGNIADSLSISVDEPRMYSLYLDEMFEDRKEIHEYLIEFFSTKNLFIPFPAVMVNHIGADFMNVVHAYNRVLNDIFEDESVNRHQVHESSIDYVIDEEYDTFFNFASGPFKPQGTADILIEENARTHKGSAPLEIARLSHKNYFVSDLLDDASDIGSNGVLKIRQPSQSMFYGRLLSGIINRKTKAFSANHSYYDSSATEEYVDNAVSHRVYPYFKGALNRVTMYPIMSPSDLRVHIEFKNGTTVTASEPMHIRSPSDRSITFDIDEIVDKLKIENCSAFRVVAMALDGRSPSRVTHQLIYGLKETNSKLLSSIAVGLSHAVSIAPADKNRLSWGQMTVAPGYASYIGICFHTFWGDAEQVHVDFYDETGLIKSMTTTLSPGSALMISSEDVDNVDRTGRFIWYAATCNRSDLACVSFHAHQLSHNASGEHGF